MCIAKNFASRQKPVFTDAETNNVNCIEESTAYIYSRSPFESSRVIVGTLFANTAQLSIQSLYLVLGSAAVERFHFLSFDLSLPPFCFVLLLLWPKWGGRWNLREDFRKQ